MEKFLGSSTSDIEKFMALGDKAQEVTILNLKKDEDYDDAPDEFIGKDPSWRALFTNRLTKILRFLHNFLDFYKMIGVWLNINVSKVQIWHELGVRGGG